MKTRKSTLIIGLLMALLISSIGYLTTTPTFGDSTELPTQFPVVYVFPETVIADVGESFTVSVIVYNLTDATTPDPKKPDILIPLGNLYGFDIQFSWDPTIIQYVNYSLPDPTRGGYPHPNVTAPIEKYPNPIPPSPYAGVLHGFGSQGKDLIEVKNVVNETGNMPDAADPKVRAWFVYATMYPTAPFNGNGTIFTMTFKVLKKGASPLEIVYCRLSDVDGNAIGETRTGNAWLNPPRDGKFRTPGAPVADFTYYPSIGVVNKTMYFNATITENVTNIATYMWDFGDGTKLNTTTPTTEHNYTASRQEPYVVSLKVVDADNVASELVTHELSITTSRDLKATSVTLSQNTVKPNRLFNVTARADNLGSAPFVFNETCTMKLFYNITVIDWSNITSASWALLGTNQTVIKSGTGGYKRITYTLNSSDLPVLEANYTFLLNVTGIPTGYEANVTNNICFSETLFYTTQTIHQPAITDFKFGYEFQKTFKVPVIEGEEVKFNVTVKNNGNEIDKFNITIYANSSVIGTSETSNLDPGASQIISITHSLNFGYYNLIAEAKAGSVVVTRQGFLRVIKPPSLVVDYAPSSPLVNQEVTFNASKSTCEDPNGNITLYTWRIYKPNVDPVGGTPEKTISSSDAVLISYTFNKSGKWNIVLEVTGTYTSGSQKVEMKYDSKRTATYAYRKTIEVTVEEPGGFPIEWIIAIIALIIVLIAAVFFVLRRRQVKIPTE